MVTDLTYLREIAKGDEDFIREMTRLFLIQIPQDIRLLEERIEKQDFPSIKEIAHKLKSSIQFAGIDKLIKPDLIEMETLATERKDLDKIARKFDKVRDICNQACEELQTR
jgi:HPt (histidine-containing phosphotransfer) domain-containing protein